MSRDILNNIINDFDPEKFIKFFRSKNTSFSPRQEELTQYNDGNFKNGKKLGEISFKDNSLIIYSFQAEQELSEKTGKKAQYEKGKKILRETQTDAGIFIYCDQNGNFRFSLIYANYLGSRRDWSTFRRFTYFVSKKFTNKTFLQRIGDGDFSSLEKIKDAFSVDKVTKSFYTDIANWYFWAVQNVSFPKDAEDEENGRNTAVIRLITRFIFIWFMKERGLVQGVLFEQSQIAQLLKDLSAEKTTYYKAILQNLFFSTLNTKIDNRKYRFQKSFQGKNVDYMDHSIYRYESYFKDNETMLSVFKDIPYLNGGLFDCLDKPSKDNENQGEVRIDGFTDKDVGLNIPNYLFFSDLTEVNLNKDYGTKNKKYTVRGIVNILSSYNFTIDENDPNDQEVALDPELLGKVFENLLASFNPETASTARKATGSYYTPREIVDYMVIQSLKNYLKTNLAESNELDTKIEQLFSNSDDTNPFTHEQTLRIVKLIDNLRVVDPAVGSGAFPMGILNKLVFALAKLDPNNTIWKETQLKAVESNVTDPVLSKKLRDQVEEQFTQKNFDYGRKLYLIQKCIYGVDIQQIAVEIAKLRFFISLLVDEKIDKTKENWGIEPLPNLDYKIMQGNSLVEEYEGVKLFDERLLNVELPSKEETNEVTQRIKHIQKDLMPYYQKNPQWYKNPKLERPSELTILESELSRLKAVQKDLEKLNQSGTKTNNQQSLLQPDEVKSQMVWMELQELHKQLFSPSLARNEKNDLRQRIDELEWRLIEETLREQGKIKELEKIKKLENSNTKPFFLWNLYFPEVFQERGGFDIVIANPPYGVDIEENDLKAIKKRLRNTANINSAAIFIDFGKNLLLNKQGTLSYIVPKSLLYSEQWFDLVKTLIGKVTVLVDVEKAFENVLLEQVVFVFGNSITTESYLARKFLNNEFIRSTQINNDMVTQFKAWICDVTNDELEIADKILNSKIKLLGNISETKRGVGLQKYLKRKGEFPVVGGKNITRYGFNGNKGYLSKQELTSNKSKVSFMHQSKIMSQNIVAHVQNPIPHLVITATYDEKGKVLALDTVNNTVLNMDHYHPKYILAIMNSSLVCWYAYKFIYCAAIRTMHFDNNYVGKIPIFESSEVGQKSIIETVDKIFEITESNDYIQNTFKQNQVKEHEQQIDQLVYKLYGLKEEEIKIVEGKSAN